MDKIDLNNANEKLNQLREIDVEGATDLPFELLRRPSNKTTKLVANSGKTQPMDGANRWFDYEFSEPIFLSEILISMQNYHSYDSFDVKWEMAQGGEITQEISRESDAAYRCKVNQLIKSISFKPPRKWWTGAKLNSVSLIGFKVNELEEFVNLVSRLQRLKTDILSDCDQAIRSAEEANTSIDNLRQERDQLGAKISENKDIVTTLNNDIGRLTEERNGLVADVKEREESISNLEVRAESIKDRIAERNTERSALATEIAEQKQELRSLQDDINMFPTEIGGFVSQAAQNIRTYWRLSWVPIGLLIIMTGLLVFNAANLTTVIDEHQNARIFSILATRIPYVVIAAAIIGASYKLAALFVTEIMRINQQRLNLSKISIIATDVSKASEEGLSNLSDEEIYSLRTRMKMDMLREHLKDYLSKDFAPSFPKKIRTVLSNKNNEQAEKPEEN